MEISTMYYRPNCLSTVKNSLRGLKIRNVLDCAYSYENVSLCTFFFVIIKTQVYV